MLCAAANRVHQPLMPVIVSMYTSCSLVPAQTAEPTLAAACDVVVCCSAARGLSLPGGASHHQLPNAHIQVCYDQECYSTSTTYNSSSPVLDEIFAFQENPGLLTRRVKLEVWHDGPSPAAHGGSSSSSSKGSGSSGIKALSKRASSGFSSGTSKGFKSVGLIKGSGKGSKTTKGAHHNNSSSSSSKVASHRLSDVPEESEGVTHSNNDDVSSHMLIDVELEDDQPEEVEGPAQQLQQQEQGGSADGDSGSSVSLGSAVVNLDQLTAATIQVTDVSADQHISHGSITDACSAHTAQPNLDHHMPSSCPIL